MSMTSFWVLKKGSARPCHHRGSYPPECERRRQFSDATHFLEHRQVGHSGEPRHVLSVGTSLLPDARAIPRFAHRFCESLQTLAANVGGLNLQCAPARE